MRVSIRWQFIAYTFGITFLVVGAVALVTTFMTRDVLIERYVADARALAASTARTVADPLYYLDVAEARRRVEGSRYNPAIVGIAVLDPDGLVMTDGTRDNRNFLRRPDDEFARGLVTAESVVHRLDGERLDVGGPVRMPDGTRLGSVWITLSLAPVNEGFATFLRSLVWVTAFALLCGVVIAMWFGWRFTRPIRSIVAVAQRVAGGEVHARAAIRRRDELGSLGTALNVMADSLTQRIDDIARAEEALRRSAAQLRLVADALPVLVAYLDLEWRVQYANQRRSIWFASDIDPIGNPLREVLAADMFELCEPNLRAATAGSDVDFEIVLDGDGHRRRVLQARFVPYRGADQAVLGVVVLMEDVTDRTAIEAQLRQAQKMEVVGQLTGGISHDFNNILTVIMGNLELLGSHPLDAAQTKNLANAMTAAEKAAVLNRRLLAFARRQLLQPRVIDVNELARGMIDMIQRVLRGDITVRLDLADRPMVCRVDPGQIEAALLNLAVNARDAMPDGGGLTIRTLAEDLGPDARFNGIDRVTPGRYVVIEVADTGTGMTQDVLARVFEPFFTTKDVGRGSGLGLSMVHGFALQSGGYVGIVSEVGRGTAVRLYLPAIAEQTGDGAPAAV